MTRWTGGAGTAAKALLGGVVALVLLAGETAWVAGRWGGGLEAVEVGGGVQLGLLVVRGLAGLGPAGVVVGGRHGAGVARGAALLLFLVEGEGVDVAAVGGLGG